MVHNAGREPADESRESPLVDAAWNQFAAVLSPSGSTPGGRAAGAAHPGPHAFPGYHVLGELHRGGQGVVYVAIQESTRRKVAIKVLRQGPFATAADRARFEREVDLLARLRHPGIVAIHDRGVAPDGVRGGGGCPFLVMDYVVGKPLDAYVAGAALGTGETLGLFRKVCEAVHAAHLVGIIHRDLKPANICVDEAGEPHVLDFGLAKLTDTGDGGGSGDGPDLTETGQFIGSLPWASPEQAEGRHDLTDVRTDVYSLGVLLFHMLTGVLPYPRAESPRRLAEHIAGTPPIRPTSVGRGISADVETIILTCLAKEPERRYQSAGDLGRDIANALAGRPIDAKRDSAAYLLRRLISRNRAATVAAGAFVLLLATTAATTTVLYRQAAHARLVAQDRLERAEREASKAAKVGEILGSLLTSMSPWEWAGANNARVLEALLDRTSAQAEAELADEPEVRAALDEVLGNGYLALNNYARAETHLLRCLELRQSIGAGQDAAVARMTSRVAGLRYAQGRTPEAESLALRALEWQLASGGEETPDAAATLSLLAELSLDRADFEAAEAYGRRALAALTAINGETHPRLIGVRHTLGVLLRASGRLDEAEAMLTEALRIGTATLPEDHPHIASSHTHLGTLYAVWRDLERGERHLREALRIRRATFDGPHEETAITLTNLAAVLAQRGAFADAETIARESIEMYRAIGAPDHGHTVNALGNLAGALEGLGRTDEAAAAYEEALSLCRGRDEHKVAAITSNIAQLRKAQGDLEGAEAAGRESLETRRRLLGDNHIDVAHSLGNLGHTLLKRGEPAEAESLLREANAIYRSLLGEGHVLVGGTMGNIGRCRLATDTGGAEAAAALEEAVRLLAAAVPPTHPRLILDRCDLAEALVRERRFDEAEASLLACERALTEQSGADADLSSLAAYFVRLYEAWEREERAEAWRSRLPAAADPP